VKQSIKVWQSLFSSIRKEEVMVRQVFVSLACHINSCVTNQHLFVQAGVPFSVLCTLMECLHHDDDDDDNAYFIFVML
jgi:hypothetical protein